MLNNKTCTALTVALTCAFAATTAEAAHVVQPGSYAITVNYDGNKMKSETCLGETDVATLESLIISTFADPLMQKSCSIEFAEQSNSNAKWEMVCKSDFVTQTTSGKISWNAKTFSGEAKSKTGNINVDYTLAGERNGACK